MPDKEIMVFFDHGLGGGTALYTKQFFKNQKSENYIIITNYLVYKFDLAYLVKYNDKIFILSHKNLHNYLNQLKIKMIFLNSVYTYSSINSLFDNIIDLYNIQKFNLIIAFHDYYPICKNLNLFCKRSNCKYYCNEVDTYNWRNTWKRIFEIATELRVFSESSKQVLLNFIPEYSSKINVIPHSLDYLKDIKTIIYNKTPINIGVMGCITTEIKGNFILAELLKQFRIHLFGETNIRSKNLINHGKYTISNIREKLIAQKINLIIFPSVCEETFSFVISEIIALGLPVICFDIGAQSEKVSKYDKGIVVKDLDEMIQKIKTFG